MDNGQIFKCNNLAQTERLGIELAAGLRNGAVVALHGPLGTGKTALSRAIARGLGVTEPVTSPTFALVMEYLRPDGSLLFHLDMYRINTEHDALAFGVEEYLFQTNAITLVEWPERIAGLLIPPHSHPEALLEVSLAHAGNNARKITIRQTRQSGSDRAGETPC